jgi:chaperone modulatory protein CbpM
VLHQPPTPARTHFHLLERDFGATPELTALIADLLNELDTLRARLRQAGLS